MMKRPAIFCSIVIAAALIFTFTVAMLKRAPKTLGSKIEEGVSLEKVSENVTFVSPEGNYSLKITAVYDAPPESDDENAPPAKRVAVVVYEYTNNDIENGLVISNSHFKAFDKNGNELKQFPQKNLFVVLFFFCLLIQRGAVENHVRVFLIGENPPPLSPLNAVPHGQGVLNGSAPGLIVPDDPAQEPQIAGGDAVVIVQIQGKQWADIEAENQGFLHILRQHNFRQCRTAIKDATVNRLQPIG